MRQYYRSFSETKQQYREIFTLAQDQIHHQLHALRQDYTCAHCNSHPTVDDSVWFSSLPADCEFRCWQTHAIQWLDETLGKSLVTQLKRIEAYRNTFSCHQCGACCRLAHTDVDYPTLQAQAQAGDSFAQQFTSVFLPYESREAARKQFPELVDAVLNEVNEPDEPRVFFHHCPYVGEDNRCTLYGNPKRPALCSSYPETPLTFIQAKCGWAPWKVETYSPTLQVHASLALAQDLSQKLQQALQSV